MNFHIVRTNETIEKIALTYNYTIEELKNINMHIRNWSNLVPGTRLKLPPIPEAITDEINDIEPFIEDYYPKIDVKRYESVHQESPPKVEEKKGEEDTNKTINVNMVEENYDLDINKQTFSPTISQKEEKNVNNFNLPKTQEYYYNPYDPYAYWRYLEQIRRVKKSTKNKTK